MQRRRALSILLSGVSITALAACGAEGMDSMTEPKAETEAKEAVQPTAEPTAAPEPTAESTAAPEPTAAPTAEPTAVPQLDLPVLGEAPEINLTKWLNSDPITMASLQGKSAALVVFWTYT